MFLVRCKCISDVKLIKSKLCLRVWENIHPKQSIWCNIKGFTSYIKIYILMLVIVIEMIIMLICTCELKFIRCVFRLQRKSLFLDDTSLKAFHNPAFTLQETSSGISMTPSGGSPRNVKEPSAVSYHSDTWRPCDRHRNGYCGITNEEKNQCKLRP